MPESTNTRDDGGKALPITTPPDLGPGDSMPAPEFLLRYAHGMPEDELRGFLATWGVEEAHLDEAAEHWREESYVEHEVRRAGAPVNETFDKVTRELRHIDTQHRLLGRVLALAPEAMRGAKIVRAASAGGKTRVGARKVDHVSDAELRAQVDNLVAEGESLTNARHRVGRLHGIPLPTMRRRTK